jgi:hypothetical protein
LETLRQALEKLKGDGGRPEWSAHNRGS